MNILLFIENNIPYESLFLRGIDENKFKDHISNNILKYNSFINTSKYLDLIIEHYNLINITNKSDTYDNNIIDVISFKNFEKEYKDYNFKQYNLVIGIYNNYKTREQLGKNIKISNILLINEKEKPMLIIPIIILYCYIFNFDYPKYYRHK